MNLNAIEFENIKKVQERAENILLNPNQPVANVIGMAIGAKWINNRPTEIPALMVLVTKKVSINELNSNDIIPSEIEGIKTDVFSLGAPVRSANILPFESNTLDKFIRPVKGGFSIGNGSILASGTCGKIVRDATDTPFPKYYILSNNHVLALSNKAKIGDPIIQPGAFDVIGERSLENFNFSRYTVAFLSNFVPIDFNYPAPNLVDAAIAQGEMVNLSPEIYGIGYINSWRTNNALTQLPILTNVKKTGQSTDTSYGKILAFNATVDIIYDRADQNSKARFRQQIMTSAMARGGDSGSLLVTANNNEAIGLLIGGNANVTFYNYIENVQNALNIIVADQKID